MRARCGALLLALFFLAGCATTRAPDGAPSGSEQQSGNTPAVSVQLRLELPMIGLSSAPTVSYATSSGHPLLRGKVSPATSTVYMLSADGTRTAVNPASGGGFAVAAKLTPGLNTFQFTAAKLGARSTTATLAVTWRGAAAAAMQKAMQADPAKYLPPASAGLNRKLPPLQGIPSVTDGSVTVSYTLDTIKAPPPPLSGGPGKWLGGFELTEYYPALESWFVGALVPTPGLSSEHRIDWLYSAHGLSMEGDGVGLDGRRYHISDVGSGGWIDAAGNGPGVFGSVADAPFWRTGGFWRTSSGAFTFPLAAGSWSNGVGVRYVPPPAGITFAPGPSRASLAYLRSVAVDPSVIPLGSHIYIPSYQSINGGWFEADDTGGAIVGQHIDVYRPPPANPQDTGNFATRQTVYVVPPGVPLP